MKKTIRIILLIFFISGAFYPGFTQPAPAGKISFTDVLKSIEENADSIAGEVKVKLFKDPELYNTIWQNLLMLEKEGRPNFLKDLNIRFKTFEGSDSNKVGLGFSYDWDYSFSRQNETPVKNSLLDFKLSASGNVAFNKDINPANFLSTRLVFSRRSFGGGFVNKPPKELRDSLTAIKMRLADLDDEEVKRSPLWGELIYYFKPRNPYYFDLNLSGGLESNQDFTLKQWAYGLQAIFSVKSYLDDNPLSQFNFLDYPFAVIRKLTGTDAELTPYGASFPIFMAGVDMVNPESDPVRKQLTGELNNFARFRFEAGFRTLFAQVETLTLYFNAGIRYYQELGASAAVKTANLDQFVFFTSSLTSNKGFFVSYSNGKLPFDAQADSIYELGFNFKF